jgi:hypothetical protein
LEQIVETKCRWQTNFGLKLSYPQVALKNLSESILVVAAAQMLDFYLGNPRVVEFYCAAINNFKNYLNHIPVVQCDKVWVAMLVAQ